MISKCVAVRLSLLLFLNIPNEAFRNSQFFSLMIIKKSMPMVLVIEEPEDMIKKMIKECLPFFEVCNTFVTPPILS